MIIDRVRFIFTRVNDNLTFFYKGNSYNDFGNILKHCNWLGNCKISYDKLKFKTKMLRKKFFLSSTMILVLSWCQITILKMHYPKVPELSSLNI